MATINYNGMELEEVTEPQIFDPPIEMAVCDESTTPKKAKVPCIVNSFEMTALCSSHFLEKKQKELCQKYLDEHMPKLNLKDFARI